MNYKSNLSSLLFIFISLISYSQSSLPSVKLMDIHGSIIDTKKLSDNNGKPIIICFIKTCCNAPLNMLDDVAEVYEY